ncbi:MAG: hypothetical protein IKI93_20295 [Clostridia bacterium]|nr:hypothetical protein [Clostridia bacterium]
MADWVIDKKEVASTVDGDFILYKNRPLVREDNIICYGSMDDKYILQMIIISEKEFRGTMIPDKVYVQLLSTDPKLPPEGRVVKEGMKNGLNDAFDIGITWLERYLAS